MSPTKSSEAPPAELTSVERNRQRAFHSAKDYETSASQIGDVVAPDVSERRKASLMVAANVPPDEIVETLMMLGIHPSQPPWDDGPNTAVTRSTSGKGM
jgi:hypothetical protein